MSEEASRGWMVFAVPFLGQAKSKLRGVMELDVAVKGRGLDQDMLLRSLDGGGKFEMAKGTTVSMGWLANPVGGRGLGVLLQMLPIGKALRDLSFERTLDGLKGEFSIKDGTIGNKMTLADPRAVITLDGQTTLTAPGGDYPIQYRLAVQSTPQSSKDLRRIAEAFGGRVTLPLAIGGTIHHPKPELKLDQLLKDFNPLQKKEGGGLPGLLEDLLRRDKRKRDRSDPATKKPDLPGILEDLLRKKAKGRDPAAPPATEPKKKPPLRFEDMF